MDGGLPPGPQDQGRHHRHNHRQGHSHGRRDWQQGSRQQQQQPQQQDQRRPQQRSYGYDHGYAYPHRYETSRHVRRRDSHGHPRGDSRRYMPSQHAYADDSADMDRRSGGGAHRLPAGYSSNSNNGADHQHGVWRGGQDYGGQEPWMMPADGNAHESAHHRPPNIPGAMRSAADVAVPTALNTESDTKLAEEHDVSEAERLVGDLADQLRKNPVTRGDVLAGGLDPCVPPSWLRVFGWVLGATALGVLVTAARQFSSVTGDADPEVKREKMRIIGATVSVIGALLWPVLWNQLAGFAVVVHHPLTLFAFLWPMIISGIDLIYSTSARNPAEQARIFGLAELSTDANTLIGVAFAVGSLLASQANRRLADATVPLLMYSLLFLIAFIVPTPTLDPNDYSGFAAGAIQRTFFNYAMGLVIAGIAVNISAQSDHGLQSALRGFCLQKQTVGPAGDLDAEAATASSRAARGSSGGIADGMANWLERLF